LLCWTSGSFGLIVAAINGGSATDKTQQTKTDGDSDRSLIRSTVVVDTDLTGETSTTEYFGVTLARHIYDDYQLQHETHAGAANILARPVIDD